MGVHIGLEACPLRKYQCEFINYVINSTFRKIFNTRSQETLDVYLEMFNCLQAERAIAIRKRKFVYLEMFNCLQAERAIAIRKRKFLNKFSVINNVLCQVFNVNAKKELESCCTGI